jgi:hypothetical protein
MPAAREDGDEREEGKSQARGGAHPFYCATAYAE